MSNWKEINAETLRKAISKLPTYEPPVELWDGIDEELTKDVIERPLRESVATLPSYDPPKMIWDQIESGLDADQAKRIRLITWRRVAMGAAAAVLLLVAFWPTFFSGSETIQIAYSEELLENELMTTAEEEVDPMVLIDGICQEQVFSCHNPEFKALQRELEELNGAIEEMQEAMGNFHNDPDMIYQLTKIEHQRDDVYKEMITFITA